MLVPTRHASAGSFVEAEADKKQAADLRKQPAAKLRPEDRNHNVSEGRRTTNRGLAWSDAVRGLQHR